MAAALDRTAMVDGLATAVGLLPEAMALGRSLGSEVDRVCFVAAGSANRAMLGLQYWIERDSPGLEVRRYFPAELMAQSPDFFGPRTLVLLASKSGSTQETVAAAEWLRAKPCRTIAFTQRADKPLAGLAQRRFIIGETAESFTGLFMAMQAVIGGLLAARDKWKLADVLLPSLAALPGAIADAAVASDARGAADAAALKDQSILYHVASGPGFTTAYVFGVCIVMEMLRLHSTALEAAEFFHGPFEVVDENTRLILILGEDPSRPLMERVVRFCAKYTPHVMVYDSRDYAMPGVDPAMRAIVAPYVLQSALKRISSNLSILLDRPLTERRYMWKTEY